MVDKEFEVIAGPCVIESRDLSLRIAERIAEIGQRLDTRFHFKASFDKANRSSIDSFRGPGIEEGIRILDEVERATRLPILTEVHEAWQAKVAAEVVDVLQVPAFLCRQTDLLIAVAKTGRKVNVKKGQFLAPWDMEQVVNKLRAANCAEPIYLTERGSSFGYNALVVDMRSIPMMKKFGVRAVFDANHSTQLPGGLGKSTGGTPEYIPTLACAAAAAGCDALFVEVHPDPPRALSDAASMLHLDQLESLVRQMLRIREALAT